MGGGGSKRKLSKDDLEFLLQKTSFSKQQIKQWYKGFMNDCPKGQLTREKFLQVYSSFFPQGNAERFCEHVFRTFDSDQSGKIDFREFLLAINITSSGNPEQKLDWAFHMYDVNGDGSIEPSEMAEIIRAIYNMVSGSGEGRDGEEGGTEEEVESAERRTKEIFDKMDVNKDGVLSKDEFVNGCLADKFLYQMLTADHSWNDQS